MSIIRKDWSLEEIGKWYDADVERPKAKVQYSTNGGVTWLPFQFARQRNEDITRIFTLAQRGNLVREIKQEKVVVTNEQAQILNPTSSFMNSVAKAQARPAAGSRHSVDHVNVFRTDGGAYWFSALPVEHFRQAQPTASLVSVIERTTYYDAVTANTNVVKGLKLHTGQQTAALRQLGYVFRLQPANDDRHIAHWWPVLTISNPHFKPEEWLSVRCARHYDESLDETFNNLGQIISVVGGKWIWGWSKRYKLGDTWIVPLNVQDTLTKRITAAGMAIEPTVAISAPEHNPVILADNTKAEVTPEYIMNVRESLEEMLKTGDKAATIDMLFKVVEYRNRCVDELKELNKVIEKARDFINDA